MRVLLLLMLVFTAGCERELSPVVDQSVRPAKLFRVGSATSVTRHEFVGRVEAAQIVDVAFEVRGELRWLPILEGQAVEQGELLAALDPTDFRLAMEQAQVELKLAAQDLQRSLALREKNVMAQSSLDEAQARHRLMELRLAQARKRLGDTRIEAPFAARVIRRFVDNHSTVEVGDEVARIMPLADMRIVVNLPEEMVATVTRERVRSTSAYFSFLPEERFALSYREHAAEADPVAQTYQVSFALDSPPEWNILPGMTARVVMELSGGAASVSVPANALQSAPDGSFFVWVSDPQSLAVARRTVEVGLPEHEMIAVTHGLAAGELIVAAGAGHLQDGMRVRPMDGTTAGR